ncbi:MAG: amidohydrolase family protein [Burkholderiales bacterium]
MAHFTLSGCSALLGVEARYERGPLDIVVAGDRIAEVRRTGEQPPVGEVIPAKERLAVAGLINGHHHSHEHYHKGRHENLPLELWMNSVRPLDPIPLTNRQVYLRTLIGAIEALRSGTTTIVDDLNVSPVLIPAHVEAAFNAYEDIGIRALVGITLFDRPFFRALPFVNEEIPGELLRELDSKPKSDPQAILDFARHLAQTRHPRSNRVGYIAAPSAPQRCTESFLRSVRAMADDYDLPVIMHVQETRLQVVTGRIMYGATMVEYLGRVGFLKPGTSLIHCVWLNPREIDVIARSGATVQHNPVSNLKLGSGIAPVRALLDAGVNVSLGTDGCGSIESASMLKVVSTAALVNKLRDDDYSRWIGAKEAWRAATVGGAEAIGLGDTLGVIEPGRKADLALYRLGSIPFVPLNNPLGQLVYAESGANLDLVMVDGKIVLRDGRLAGIDEPAILAEIAEEHARLLPLIEDSERKVSRINDAYRRIYARCLKEEIASDTHQARLDAK